MKNEISLREYFIGQVVSGLATGFVSYSPSDEKEAEIMKLACAKQIKLLVDAAMLVAGYDNRLDG